MKNFDFINNYDSQLSINPSDTKQAYFPNPGSVTRDAETFLLTGDQMEALQEQNENYEEEISNLKQEVKDLQHTQQQHD